MELKEIINRQPREYSTEEIEFVVSEYVRIRKGIKVEVNTLKGIPPEFMEFLAPMKLSQLQSGFDIAYGWLINNEYDDTSNSS